MHAVLRRSVAQPGSAEHDEQVLGVDLVAGSDSTSATVPSRSACSAVSIFIASIDKRTSPAFTACPGATASVETTPGIGAPTWRSLPGSILRRARNAIPPRTRSGTLTRRGWPLSSKNTVTMPLSSISPTAKQRMTSVLPRSRSTKISSWGFMP